ncbi:MAG: hypothetical protein CMD34_05235 [Flavobacteriales bacterium]|nr:hypothetical protein [Flavobacteriales bacterium]
MKRFILIILIIVNVNTYAQDYSFSQFDLNMLYSNPAFAGYENDNRILIHRRNQWAGISEKFNSNIIELNLSGDISSARFGRGKISWAGGVYLIEDHENLVFKEYNIGIIPWTFHFQLPKNFFISMGMQNVISYHTLDWSKLIFSDQIDALGLVTNQSSANIPIYDKYTNWFDPSVGFIITKNGFQQNYDQSSSVGFAVHHLNRMIESFYNNQASTSKLPVKYTIHAQHKGNVPNVISRTFKYWKVFARHERQAKYMKKDEVGFSTILSNNLQMEFGTIYRIGRFISDNSILMSESIIPLVRIRMKPSKRIGMEMSYSYDFNISKLQNINTLATHEINLNFYFIKRKPRPCPAIGNWKN